MIKSWHNSCKCTKTSYTYYGHSTVRGEGKNYANFYLVVYVRSFHGAFWQLKACLWFVQLPPEVGHDHRQKHSTLCTKKIPNTYWHWAGWCFSFEGMVCIPWTIFLCLWDLAFLLINPYLACKNWKKIISQLLIGKLKKTF